MKDIPGYEGIYAVTSCGRVWSYRRGRFLVPRITSGGHEEVELCSGTTCLVYVHRLVAMAYIPNPDNLPVVNHKDENPRNNCVNNLEWCTQKYNVNYSLPYCIRCVETGEEYKSVTECATKNKINIKALRKHLFAGYRLIGRNHFEWIISPEDWAERYPKAKSLRITRKEKVMGRGNRLGQELLQRIEALEQATDQLERQLQVLQVQEAQNPTNEWNPKKKED